MNYLSFFFFLKKNVFGCGVEEADGQGGKCHVNTSFARCFIVTGPRLYFYDHSFVN